MIIGITGGIGSGKSTIAQELTKRGYQVYDCDREAKRIATEERVVRSSITHLLGEEAYTTIEREGLAPRIVYNTAYVAKRAFADPDILRHLNAIIHPILKHEIRLFKEHYDTFFVESAILFESGLDRMCDKIAIVCAPDNVRIKRTIKRDYNGESTPENIAAVKARMNRQTSFRLPAEDAPSLSFLRYKAQSIMRKIAGAVYPITPVIYLNNDGKTPIPELTDSLLEQL